MRKFVMAALAAACLIPAPAATADGEITVTVQISAGTVAPPGVEMKSCEVEVPDAADGLDALEAAKADGCIESYETQDFPPYGAFVTCIDGLCGTAVTFWALYVDGVASEVGVSSLALGDGDELEFSYKTWLACPDPALCV